MGALTEDELRTALDGARRGRGLARGLPRALLARVGGARPDRPGPRQARQRDGPARRARSGDADRAGPRLRATTSGWRWPASGPTSPPPTRRTTTSSAEQLAAFAPGRRGGARDRAGLHRPRRQQRGHAARPADALRHGPLRDRDLRPRSLPARSGRARTRAGARAALLRRRREALRARGQRRLRPHLAGAGGHLGRGAADRLRRRRPARALQQRGGPRGRPPLSAGRHGLDGQHHDRPRSRDRRRAGRAGGPDRRRRAPSGSWPRRWRPGSRRSTTR